MREESALDGILVAELGNRIAAGVAGTLLAQAGADVVVVESDEPGIGQRKWASRARATAGKRSIHWARGKGADDTLLQELIAAADVVIISSDVDVHWRDVLAAAPDNPRRIVCDITAYGSTGPLRGQPDSDLLVQAASGIMDVTGMANEPPTAVGMPVTEVSAGLYGAAAIAAALRSRDLGGAGQEIEVSLYDCAVNAQATFLPLHFAGRVPRRAGNRHSMCAPWNCYKAQDRWILVCSATNDQWLRLCEVMGRADLATKPELKNLADRLARCDEVDEAVQLWVGARDAGAT
jgi:crotonobetainyl-CoA:carnitine CoA-transferase CaiB-like acyl-CoA transferase